MPLLSCLWLQKEWFLLTLLQASIQYAIHVLEVCFRQGLLGERYYSLLLTITRYYWVCFSGRQYNPYSGTFLFGLIGDMPSVC